jgi:CRP/FNR family transcriptional regulator
MTTWPPSLTKVLDTARLKTFAKGQVIFYEGDSLADVLLIKSGVIKIYDIDERGNEKILHLASNPGLVPLAFFSGRTAHTRWYYAALTDCQAYVISNQQLTQIMSSDPAISLFLVNHFSQDVHELLTRLSSLGKSQVYDKVVAAFRFLLTSHAKKRLDGWWQVSFPVNHQLLADMIGVTRESVTVVMKELIDQKVIRCPRVTVVQINKSRLQKITQNE